MLQVKLGSGHVVSLAAYVARMKALLAEPPERIYNEGLNGACDVSVAQILDQFRDGIHDRINHHLPWWPMPYRNTHTRTNREHYRALRWCRRFDQTVTDRSRFVG